MKTNNINWPNGKRFSFTIIDDTDNSTVSNIAPVYSLLKECGLITTKTVWVYPPRDQFKGQCLKDEQYLEFIRLLIQDGFEIASHGVGSGNFKSEEIEEGFREFNNLLGFYPNIHINHSRNPDNIYWGYKRFVFPLAWAMKMSKKRRLLFQGENPNSQHYWGDLSKLYIKYRRNHVFNGINTLKQDPCMPAFSKSKEKYANYWFSSSDGHTIKEFNALINKKNIDMLEREGGCCIVYTHFAEGFVDETGTVNKEFEERIKYLKSKDGWFVPVGEILDFLLKTKNKDACASYPYLLGLDLRWTVQRLIKRLRFGH